MKKHQKDFLLIHGPQDLYDEQLKSIQSGRPIASSFFDRVHPSEESQHALIENGGEEAAKNLLMRSPQIHSSSIEKIRDSGLFDGDFVHGYLSVRASSMKLHPETIKKIYETWPARDLDHMWNAKRLPAGDGLESLRHALNHEELPIEELAKAKNWPTQLGKEGIEAFESRIKERSK